MSLKPTGTNGEKRGKKRVIERKLHKVNKYKLSFIGDFTIVVFSLKKHYTDSKGKYSCSGLFAHQSDTQRKLDVNNDLGGCGCSVWC